MAADDSGVFSPLTSAACVLLATAALRFPLGCDRDDTLVLPALIRITKDKSPEIRAEAARALGSLKLTEKVPSQLFVSLFGDSNAELRRAAVEAFSWAHPPEAIRPAIGRLVDDPDVAVRTAAKKLLNRLRENEEQ